MNTYEGQTISQSAPSLCLCIVGTIVGRLNKSHDCSPRNVYKLGQFCCFLCQNWIKMVCFCLYAKYLKKCKRFSNKAAKAFPPIFPTPTRSYFPIELSLVSQKEGPHFDSIRCVPKKSHVALESNRVWPEDQQSSWQVFFSHRKISMMMNIVERLIQLKVHGGGRLCFFPHSCVKTNLLFVN